MENAVEFYCPLCSAVVETCAHGRGRAAQALKSNQSSSPTVPGDETLDRLLEDYWRDSRVGTSGEMRLAQEAIRRHVTQAIESAVRKEKEEIVRLTEERDVAWRAAERTHATRAKVSRLTAQVQAMQEVVDAAVGYDMARIGTATQVLMARENLTRATQDYRASLPEEPSV